MQQNAIFDGSPALGFKRFLGTGGEACLLKQGSAFRSQTQKICFSASHCLAKKGQASAIRSHLASPQNKTLSK
jgi:hypothetical protein